MAGPSPALAALLATLVPGGGQLYLDNEMDALATAATEAAFVGAILAAPEAGEEARLYHLTPRFLGALTLQQVHVYSIYAAYRDARLARGNRGFKSPMADHGIADLLAAPVTPEIVGDPEVLLPVLGVIGVATGLALWNGGPVLVSEPVDILGYRMTHGEALAAQTPVHGVLSMGAAVSEETLFRGMVQSGMLEWWSPSRAVATQAALFGIAHAPNAFLRPGSNKVERASLQVAVTSLLGAWMGYMTWADRGDLRRAVAFHFWYDMVVMTAGFLSAPREWPLRFTLTLPFG